MYSFDINISDSPKALRAERKKRMEPAEPDKALENELWSLFYDYQYDLNIGGESPFKYGRDGEMESKNIDVIARSKDLVVFAEASTQKEIGSKIKTWIKQSKLIKKHLNDFPTNYNFVFYTYQTVAEGTQEAIRRAGFILLTPERVENFKELKKNHPDLAHYDLITFICKRKKIIEFVNGNGIEIPAIRAKYGFKRQIYLFAIHPAKLLKLARIPRRVDHGKRDDEHPNYQRQLKEAKVKQIRKFIKDEGGVFPTNIIVSINSKPEFKGFKGSSQFGILELEPEFGSITIIDGQHRLYGYNGTKESERDYVFISAFEDLSANDQLETFFDINKKQTSVSSSLMWDLYTDLIKPHDPKTKPKETVKWYMSALAKSLNDNEKSPLYGLIRFDSSEYERQTKCHYTLEGFGQELSAGRKSMLDKVRLRLELDKNYKDNKAAYEHANEILEKLLIAFFNCIKKYSPNDFSEDKIKNRTLFRDNYGSYALINVFRHKLNDCFENPEQKGIVLYQNIDSCEKLFEPEIQVLCDWVESLDLDKKESIKSGGKARSKKLLTRFIQVIRAKFKDFAPEYEILDEPEIDSFLKRLQQENEGPTLETKYALFTNTERMLKTSEVVGYDEKNNGKENQVDKILGTCVGMANLTGGNIIIGVRENDNKDFIREGIEKTDLSLKDSKGNKYNIERYKKRFIQLWNSSTVGDASQPQLKILEDLDGLKFLQIKIKPIPKDIFDKKGVEALAKLKASNSDFHLVYTRLEDVTTRVEPKDQNKVYRQMQQYRNEHLDV